MQSLTGGCLDDPRVDVRIDDVATVIRAATTTYDAILLDVDNGPDGLTREGNDVLYTVAGLTSTRAALRSGGVLAVWSAGPDPAFTHRLKKAGFAVDEVRVRARENGKGPMHHIWLGMAR
jgi:spermidine synthase